MCTEADREKTGVLEVSGTEGPPAETANSRTEGGAGLDSFILCLKGRLAEERAGESDPSLPANIR